MDKFLKSIEFDRYLDIFIKEAKTQKGKKYFYFLDHFDTVEGVKSFHNHINDLMYLSDIGKWNGFNFTDIGEIIETLISTKQTLAANELYILSVVLKDISIIANIFEETSFAHKIPPISLEGQYKAVFNAIDRNGQIRDNATDKLKNIREKLFEVSNRIEGILNSMLNKYAPFLQDTIITKRNERYVIPVKSGYKNKVKGVIHDRSDSGQTLFMEPIELIEATNEQRELELEEEREIFRILSNLTLSYRNIAKEVERWWKFIVYLDILQSTINVMAKYDAILPVVSNDFPLIIKRGYHPLIKIIKEKQTVPYDFIWNKDINGVVVSGPNTGGKTVFLKTIGLFVASAAMGLPVFAREGTIIPFVKSVFVDMGDKQSIDESLSTFSAHLENIKQIDEKSQKGHLLILDEPGGGTDPDEGAALGIGVMEYFMNKGLRVLASSHFSRIKHYATDRDYVMNVSMGFNADTLRPTYKLQINVPGLSLGISTAERLGLPQEITRIALDYMDKKIYEVNKLLEELNEERNKIDKEREKLREIKMYLEEENAKIVEIQDRIKQKEKRIKKEMQNKTDLYLENMRKELEKTIKELKTGIYNKEDIKELRKKLSPPKIKEEREERYFNVGDIVKREESTVEGEIIKVLRGNFYLIDFNGINQRLPGYKLVKVKNIANPKSKSFTRDIYEPDNVMEINIIGQRRDEAEWEVMRFIDNVYTEGLGFGRIVHGKGQGILKLMVQEVLSKDKRVKSFSDAPPEHGGGGVTVFYFK